MATRDTVFTPGGQPSITYVERSHLSIEASVTKAVKTPNQIVSLSGPTKSGKTVLCRKALNDEPYIWLEGGQINDAKEIWEKVCYELNLPDEILKSQKSESKGEVGGSFFVSASGSHLRSTDTAKAYKIDSMASAIRQLNEERISLVIDDFHYLSPDARKSFLRNIKGPVFNGLKIVLLSVSHRGNDAIKGEPELLGRVTSIIVPEWAIEDLKLIAERGFEALNIHAVSGFISRLAHESQSSPFLMQQLCSEICAGLGVNERAKTQVKVPTPYDITPICGRLANDSGHPIYHQLEVGPQSRKARKKRPLKSGGFADIYKAILSALAATGPESSILYEDLRKELVILLDESALPQKHEITSALKQLAKISQGIGGDAGLDWDEDMRKIEISDPYLRFYLRWKIRPVTALPSGRSPTWNFMWSGFPRR